jgi:hypothetical protein
MFVFLDLSHQFLTFCHQTVKAYRMSKFFITLFLLWLLCFDISAMHKTEPKLTPIEYTSSNFFNILEPSKNPDLFFTHDGTFFCCKSLDPNDLCYHFEKTFFCDQDLKNYDAAMAQIQNDFGGERSTFFSGLTPALATPRFAEIESHYDLPHRVYESALNSTDTQEQQETVKIMGCKFKLHIQVKPEYLIYFINDLFKFLSQTQRFYSVKTFKVIDPNLFHEIERLRHPIIIIYLPIFYESDAVKRSEFLDSFILPIAKRYENLVSTASWIKSEPRFSHKINDLIYIAGGEGFIKCLLKSKLEELYNSKGFADLSARIFRVFTRDFHFIKGFEYIPSDTKL